MVEIKCECVNPAFPDNPNCPSHGHHWGDVQERKPDKPVLKDKACEPHGEVGCLECWSRIILSHSTYGR